MFRILILLVLGVGVGYMLRGRSFVGVTKWSIQITVCVLFFVSFLRCVVLDFGSGTLHVS